MRSTSHDATNVVRGAITSKVSKECIEKTFGGLFLLLCFHFIATFVYFCEIQYKFTFKAKEGNSHILVILLSVNVVEGKRSAILCLLFDRSCIPHKM